MITRQARIANNKNSAYKLISRVLIYLYRTILIVLLAMGFYNFSLSIDTLRQIKSSDRLLTQNLEFSTEESNQYIFAKTINFTPSAATYLSNSGRLYIYLKKEGLNSSEIKNLAIEITREAGDEVCNFLYDFTNAEEASENYQCDGFYSLMFPTVKLHIDYNDILVKIRGITLSEPREDTKVVLQFSGIKRRLRYLTYFFQSCRFLAGALILSLLHFLVRKVRNLIKKKL